MLRELVFLRVLMILGLDGMQFLLKKTLEKYLNLGSELDLGFVREAFFLSPEQ